MPHAIIRGKDGRRHEVDFGDDPVRVEIYSREETVEIFIGADFETLQRRVGASPFSASPSTSLAKLRAQQRDVPQNPINDEAVAVCSKGYRRPCGAAYGRIAGRVPSGPGQIPLNGFQ
jgi:hypothetical protein